MSRSRRSVYASVRGLLGRPGGNLLFLRAFLGVTFCVASLQKLSNPNFFAAHAPGSFAEQLAGAIVTSPLHHLLSPATHATTLIAVLISAGELAVGLGTLFGLFSRFAALGGMLLSLLFFLTVSFNDSPYYYGADIVFLFAWTPLALGGAGELSLDAFLASRATRSVAAPGPNSPVGERSELERRVFLQRAAAAGVLGATGAVLGGAVAAVGRQLNHAPPTGAADSLSGSSGGAPTTTTDPGTSTTTSTTSPGSTPTTTTAQPKGTKIGPAADIPVGGAASFTDPAQGIPAYVVQPTAGRYVAFSAICTHAGCTVQFQKRSLEFVCPCHGSVYNATTGAVIDGPAPAPLPGIPVELGPGGELYADG